MVEVHDNEWLCVDCGMIIANGDDSGIEDAQAHRAAMAACNYADGYDIVLSGCPEGDYCEHHPADLNGDTECRFDRDFSSARCCACDTTLAGHRFAAALIERN